MRLQLFGIRLEIGRVKARPPLASKPAYKTKREASQSFWSAFCGCGTIVATCGCGRTHFATHTEFDFEDGELEDLRKRAQERPSLYLEDASNDSVSVIDMPGGLIIWGCPCHKAEAYERFLLDYRHPILDFYRHVFAKKKADLQRDQEALKEANNG